MHISSPTRLERLRVVVGAGLLAAALGLGSAVATADASPAPPVAVANATIGDTTDHNVGADGQCTWGAIEQFHNATGLYPVFEGDALNWNDSAPGHGWTVVPDPQARSIVVFEPGVAGADSTLGHVAWVTSVQDTEQGRMVTFTEMNGPAGPGQYNERTTAHQAGMSYILAP